ERLEAADESFLGSVPATSFVVMSLSSIGLQDHPIVRRGIEFLLSSVRADSSWSVTPNLAVSNTPLALNGLGALAKESLSRDWPSPTVDHTHNATDQLACQQQLDWLISCQRREPNRVTEVAEGGWAASDSIGSLPSTIATAQVLSALAKMYESS